MIKVLMSKLYLLLAGTLLVFITACNASPTPTTIPPTGAPINPPVLAATPNAAATETAVAVRIFATLTASAPQLPTLLPPTAVPLTVATTVAATPVATSPPPTVAQILSPSITPAALVPTIAPTSAPANPTQVPEPTRAPVNPTRAPALTRAPTQAALQVSREALRGKILFRRGGNYHIMNPDGSGLERIPNEPANRLYFSLKPLEGYSPDRSLVVVGEYTCYVLNTCHLYIGEPSVVLKRSQGQWITSKNGERADNPVWSPDGSWIAFIWNRGTDKTKNIYKGLWAEQNQDFKRLTNFYAGKDTKDPTYSPDGSMLAFATQDGPRWQIWVLDVTAESCQKRGEEDTCPSNPHNISNSQFNDTDPIWIK